MLTPPKPRSRNRRVAASTIASCDPPRRVVETGCFELIHIGQAVLSFGGTVDYFVNTVFNYPTLAECYKVAAFDGVNRIGSTGARVEEIA
jgi:hypothetical protein